MVLKHIIFDIKSFVWDNFGHFGTNDQKLGFGLFKCPGAAHQNKTRYLHYKERTILYELHT